MREQSHKVIRRDAPASHFANTELTGAKGWEGRDGSTDDVYKQILDGLTIYEKVRLYELLQCLWRSRQDVVPPRG